MFTQAIVFQLPPNLVYDDQSLQAAFTECALKPVGPLELFSAGFVSPFGGDSEAMVHQVGRCILLAVGREDRILPSGVVNDELERRLKAIEEKEGRRPGGRTRKRIKDEVITDLMPRAFTKRSCVEAYIDRDRALLVVDTTSRKVAENVVSEIRRAVGSFPALPLYSESAPVSVLTDWLSDAAALPDSLSYGDECVLKSFGGDGDTAKLAKHDLTSEEVLKHLAAGKHCHQIGVSFDDRLSAVVDEKLTLRKLKLIGLSVEKLEAHDAETLEQEIDARFALFTGEFGSFLDTLFKAMRVSRPQAANAEPAAQAA
jgi:recombination associated protein RdgC